MPDLRFSGTWGYLHRATDDGRVLTGWPPGMPRGEVEVSVRVIHPVAAVAVCEGYTEVVHPTARNVLRAHGVIWFPGNSVEAVLSGKDPLYLRAELAVLRTQAGPAEFAFGARTEITDWRLTGLVLGREPAWRCQRPVHFWRA